MHNLTDGILIAAAFRACGSEMGWTVAASTVAHELAQEIADYAVLTSPVGGAMKPHWALLVNFASGLSVVVGVVVLLASGVISEDTIGLVLAFGGGTYIARTSTSPQLSACLACSTACRARRGKR